MINLTREESIKYNKSKRKLYEPIGINIKDLTNRKEFDIMRENKEFKEQMEIEDYEGISSKIEGVNIFIFNDVWEMIEARCKYNFENSIIAIGDKSKQILDENLQNITK